MHYYVNQIYCTTQIILTSNQQITPE